MKFSSAAVQKLSTYARRETNASGRSAYTRRVPFGVTLTNPEPLLRYIDEPTRPHVIRARVKAALAWPGGAHPVKSVHHPGTPGKHRLAQLPGVLAGLFEAQLDRRVTPLLRGDVFSVAGGFEAFT